MHVERNTTVQYIGCVRMEAHDIQATHVLEMRTTLQVDGLNAESRTLKHEEHWHPILLRSVQL